MSGMVDEVPTIDDDAILETKVSWIDDEWMIVM